jgi:L-asparaginase
MPRLAVTFTSGTISMRSEPTGSGNAPALGATALLQLVPGIERIAEVEPIDWGLMPGSHLTFEQVLDIGRLIQSQLEQPEIDGVVVVQGTDNIEETAFAWDQAADAVRKTHTHAYATFQSVNAGQLGMVADGRVVLVRRRRPVRLPSFPDRVPPVAFVAALLGNSRPYLDADAEGVIVQAMGGGNTQAELLEAAREAMQRGATVVLTTRCPSGGVRPGYGFPGGSSTWWEAGAVFSGWLDALKARVALVFALGASLERSQIVELFSTYGDGSSR